MLLIDLLTSVAGLTCVFLAGRNSKYNFWVGYVYSLLLFLMFWNKNLYANLILQPISLGINVLGHYRFKPASDFFLVVHEYSYAFLLNGIDNAGSQVDGAFIGICHIRVSTF